MPVLSFFRIGNSYGSASQQIVDADAVEIRQLVENGYGNIQLAPLIIRIGRLMDLQKIRKCFLLDIVVLTQVTQPVLIHNNHP